jgi:queuosine precursor transporter
LPYSKKEWNPVAEVLPFQSLTDRGPHADTAPINGTQLNELNEMSLHANSVVNQEVQKTGLSHIGAGALLVLTLHTSLLVSSNVGGAKLIALPLGLTASATVISYMLTFFLISIATEIYGGRFAKLMVALGFVAMVVAVLFFELTLQLPAASTWNDQEALGRVIRIAPRLLVGGWSAYAVSQLVAVALSNALKKASIWLYVRSVVSLAVAQLIDTFIFIVIAFYDNVNLLQLITGQYLIKIAITLVGSPLVPLVIHLAKARPGLGEDAASPVLLESGRRKEGCEDR